VRVIGGTHRGRPIASVSGRGTRPTGDRVREAVFNILGGRLDGERVLDLYAGTGALGIEALSRGAGSAGFIDRDRAAVATVTGNLETLGLADRAAVVRRDLTRRPWHLPAGPFDLVFMDPPYRLGLIPPTLAGLRAEDLLAPGARVVAEHGTDDPTPTAAGFTAADRRRYGKTLVTFFVCDMEKSFNDPEGGSQERAHG